MTNFVALIENERSEELYFGVLLFHSLVPGRFHWYVLGIDNMPLIRGVVNCDDEPADERVCIDQIKETIATKLGVTVQQIKLIDGAAEPMACSNITMHTNV